MVKEEPAPSISLTLTSTSLLEGLKDPGNGDTWRAFVERYRPMLVSYARRSFGMSRADAEDAAQEAMNAFFEQYMKGAYDRDKGRLRKWLFGIATNKNRALLRKNARTPEIQVSGQTTSTGFMDRVPDDTQLEQAWDKEWQRAIFRQCFEEVRHELDEKTINAYIQYAKEQQPAETVAAELGMSINAVYLAKHHVLKRIRDMIPTMEEVW